MRSFSPFLSLFMPFSAAFAVGPILPIPIPKMAQELPALGLQKDSVTVSGISSGAFMAIQLGVAYSNQIKGVATVAGGIYGCSEGKVNIAAKICMENPESLDAKKFVDLAKKHYQKSFIDNPANLAQQRVFIIHGTQDNTILPAASFKLEEFYRSFQASLRLEYGLKMGHGFPSSNGKNDCEISRFPWINNCNYEGAKEILQTFYGPLKAPAEKDLSGELITIDQSKFAKAEAKMLRFGNLYIPAECRDKNSQCRLHIALHGCLQGPQLAQNAFIIDADYNTWADNNKIVVLYPAVAMNSANPNGCWDWFGYTGKDYAVKSSPQMTAIMNMVQKLTQKN